MSTEALEALIDESFFHGDAEFDDLKVLLDVYSERNVIPSLDVDAALASFRRDYIGQSDHYPIVDADNTHPAAPPPAAARPFPWIRRRALRNACVAAILIFAILFLYASPVSAYIFPSIADKRGGVVWYGNRGRSVEASPELDALIDAIAAYGLSEKVAPTRLPKGFLSYELTILPLQSQTIVNALFMDGNEELAIQIAIFDGEAPRSYERDPDNMELYRRNGIEHWIMRNLGKVSVVWDAVNYECMITGDITEDEAKQMIDSIYER